MRGAGYSRYSASVRALLLRCIQRPRFVSSDASSKFRAPFLEQKREANFTMLTPLSLLHRAAKIYGEKTSFYKANKAVSWKEVLIRIRRFASILVTQFHIKELDVVSVLSPNTYAFFELHFSIPATRAVLHSINIRLESSEVAFQLKHSESKLLIVDEEFVPLALNALSLLPSTFIPPTLIVIPVEEEENAMKHSRIDKDRKELLNYGSLVAEGDESFLLLLPRDEWDAMTLNYTSGTTGDPKGVVTHHRGMYLNALANVIEQNIPLFSKYLWIVPLFHCNGWCFAYTMAAVGGTSFFVRQIRADSIFSLISKHGIEFLCGAPILMNIMLASNGRYRFTHSVTYLTAGAAPSPALIQRFEDEIGIRVRTAYGLTEVYGPMSTNIPTQGERDIEKEEDEEDYSLRSQLAYNCITEDMTVIDTDSNTEVPADGLSMGEIVIKGNIVMKGYLSNEKGTESAFANGYFHTGDLGVLHPSLTVEIKDRSKDIIISGGENICSIELENLLQKHEGVAEVAVVAKQDAHWGEVPCAFVKLRPEYRMTASTESDMKLWCRQRLAGFKVPKYFIFDEELPRTSTGKLKKHLLRKVLSERFPIK